MVFRNQNQNQTQQAYVAFESMGHEYDSIELV